MPLTRSFAGVFDVNPQADRSRLLGALAPQRAHARELGPLQVAYTGASVPAASPLCLLAGHIDNAAPLRAELQAAPAGPVESLLCEAYLHWGPGLPSRLRGDFVLLIWDSRRERGLIARDQLGVRCLYVHERAGTLSFATEVHELLGLLPSRPSPDRAGLAHWIAASTRPGESTLYEGVRRLAPGSMLVLERTRARARARAPLLDANIRAAVRSRRARPRPQPARSARSRRRSPARRPRPDRRADEWRP